MVPWAKRHGMAWRGSLSVPVSKRAIAFSSSSWGGIRGSGQSALVLFYRKIRRDLLPMTKAHFLRWDIQLAIRNIPSLNAVALATTTIGGDHCVLKADTLTHSGDIPPFIFSVGFLSDHPDHQRQLSFHNPKFILFEQTQCRIVQSPASFMPVSNHIPKMAVKWTSMS